MKKIFLSWQSDTPGNRTYLENVLEKAVDGLDDWEIVTATTRAQGAVDIAQAIMDRIDDANLFVADISTINSADDQSRKTPNPNVVYELGYAVGKLGTPAIILVGNKETTTYDDVPFDLRNRLLILKKFTEGNKNRLASEFREIILGHVPIDQAPLRSPYIYLQPTSMSASSLQFAARNDEDQEYRIVAIEMDEQEVTLRRALPPRETTHGIQVSGLPSYPFQDPIPTISFVVGRLDEHYRIHQRVITSARADGRYNLDALEPGPYKIDKVPAPRLLSEVVPLAPTGGSINILFRDQETSHSATLKVSHSLLRSWNAQNATREKGILQRLAKAINDTKMGNINGEYTLSTYSSASTPRETIEWINSGALLN